LEEEKVQYTRSKLYHAKITAADFLYINIKKSYLLLILYLNKKHFFLFLLLFDPSHNMPNSKKEGN